MNISVPDELAGRVRELKLRVSAICQRALAEAVSRQGGTAGADLAVKARELAAMLNDFADGTDSTACRRSSRGYPED